MADNMSENANRMSEDASSTVQDVAGQAKEYAREGYEYAADKTRQVKSQTEGLIHDNPWYAVGIALGVGVVVGMMLRGGRG